MTNESYVGIVEENEATAVSFTGMGVVKRMLVREGQAVGRGQLLALMDDTQARNLLTGAEAQMAQAEDALQRYGMLHDAGSLPEVQWVEIQSKVAQARSQLAVAKKNLADCRLVAPVSGIIGRQQVKAGETAVPSQAVVTILDVSRVKVKVSVPEAEMNAITPHTPSMIIVEAAGKKVSGGRIEKGVVADAMTHTYDIRINVPNGDRKLLPGMVAQVKMKTSPCPSKGGEGLAGSGITLPITSVQRRPDGSLFVWTVDNQKKAHRTAVTVGASQGNRISIMSGVTAGPRVVTEGYQKLSEGTEVRI
jgi:RND family efflux transporter MFP subunit